MQHLHALHVRSPYTEPAIGLTTMSRESENNARAHAGSRQQVMRNPRPRIPACELCAAPLAFDHQHLLELEHRRVLCACNGCTILFGGNPRQRYRRIPRDVRRLRGFALDDQQWNSLLIPTRLAFFVRHSPAGRMVAQYPSAGGVMESSLEPESWRAVVEQNPVLRELEPDVEALLVNRLVHPAQYYRAPIDHCLRLVGILRTHWRGVSGGPEVWQHIDHFFLELRQACGEEQSA